jgi:hypothetical protein
MNHSINKAARREKEAQAKRDKIEAAKRKKDLEARRAAVEVKPEA